MVVDRQHMLATVCETCAGTNFGSTTTCSVHNRHIGHVEACPAWDKHLAVQQQQQLADDDGQLALPDLQSDPPDWMREKVEEWLKDYAFLGQEIDRLLRELQGDIGEDQIGSIGDVNASIRAKYKISDKTGSEATRRVRNQERIEELLRITGVFDKVAQDTADHKERTVLEMLMAGEKNNGRIMNHIRVSREYYYRIKRAVIKRLTWAMHDADLLKRKGTL